jgi:hypothetical protein
MGLRLLMNGGMAKEPPRKDLYACTDKSFITRDGL